MRLSGYLWVSYIIEEKRMRRVGYTKEDYRRIFHSVLTEEILADSQMKKVAIKLLKN